MKPEPWQARNVSFVSWKRVEPIYVRSRPSGGLARIPRTEHRVPHAGCGERSLHSRRVRRSCATHQQSRNCATTLACNCSPAERKDIKGVILAGGSGTRRHRCPVRTGQPFAIVSWEIAWAALPDDTRPGETHPRRVPRIFDVAVDTRPDSPTFGRWEAVHLDAKNQHQLYVRSGSLDGFCVLNDAADVLYKVSSGRDASTESGFRWDDPEVGV